MLDYGEHGAVLTPGDTLLTVSYAEQQPWSARPDAHSEYRAGFEIRTLRLCRRILMFHRFVELGPAPCLVRSLDSEYAASMPDTAQLAEVTYLTAATARGYTQHAGELYDLTSRPPISYRYEALRWQTAVQELAPEDAAGAPEGLSERHQWVDLYGEGISGILSEQGGALYYKNNLGDGQFTAARAVARTPSFHGLGARRSRCKTLTPTAVANW